MKTDETKEEDSNINYGCLILFFTFIFYYLIGSAIIWLFNLFLK